MLAMDLAFAIGILAFSLLAGLLGSLLGLGGGVIIIPALTLGFGYPMQAAIGASLMAVIASSTGSASYYVEEGLSNIRLGMVLEIATTLGSVIGALIAVYTDQYILAAAFGVLLLYSAFHMIRRPEAACDLKSGPCGPLDLSSSYIDKSDGKRVEYGVKKLGRGMFASLGAGGMSGLLGVGGAPVTREPYAATGAPVIARYAKMLMYIVAMRAMPPRQRSVRAVFEVSPADGLTLVELSPFAESVEQVRAATGCPFRVAQGVRAPERPRARAAC